MPKPHVLIAGTGRAGTSFLVRLLTRCGVDTGYRGDEAYNPLIRAGCERFAVVPETVEQWDALPHVVKSPYLSLRIKQVRDLGIPIDAVIVPVRDLGEVLKSRVASRTVWTGGTTRERMAQALGEVVAGCLASGVRLDLLNFRSMVHPASGDEYLWDRLSELFGLTDQVCWAVAHDELCRENRTQRRGDT